MSTEPTQEAAFFSTIRSWGIVRSDQRVFGGVLSGVGARIGMAAAPARIIFVLIALFSGGLAAIAYAAAWALLPDAEGRIIIQDFGRGTPNVGALVAIGVLTLFGFIGLDNWGVRNALSWWGAADTGLFDVGPTFVSRPGHLMVLLIPLAIVGGIIWVIVWSVRQGQPTDRAAQGYARLPDGTIPDAPAPAAAVVAMDATVAAPVEQATREAATTDEAAPASALAMEPAPVAYAPPVYSAPRAPYTPKPRVPGPGKFGYLTTLALIPFTIAVTLYLVAADKLAVFPLLAAGVIFVAGLGLVLVVNALRGRKAGFLGFVSFVALIPVGVAIAFAPQIRDHYESGDWSIRWNTIGNQDSTPESSPTPLPFDAADAFSDYDAVSIQGTCYAADPETPWGNGSISLTTVPADQTITVTQSDTTIAIPYGTSLRIEGGSSWTEGTSLQIGWIDRDIVCDTNGSAPTVVELTHSDAPVVTVRLEDGMQVGYMNLWIEEN